MNKYKTKKIAISVSIFLAIIFAGIDLVSAQSANGSVRIKGFYAPAGDTELQIKLVNLDNGNSIRSWTRDTDSFTPIFTNVPAGKYAVYVFEAGILQIVSPYEFIETAPGYTAEIKLEQQ